MDQIRTGRLIRQLRTDCGLTQKQLAERINVSDKAVSKWECGSGCPDVSLLTELAEVLGPDVRTLLTGEIDKNESEKGNMKDLRFYVCGECGNIITASSDAQISCCGRALSPLEAKEASETEKLKVTETDGEWYITSNHPMTKEHHIAFVAHLDDSSVTLRRCYPEWDLQLRMPLFRTGRLVWYCTECGLFTQKK